MIHVLEVAVTLELDKSGDVAYLRFTNLPAEDARRVRAALIEDRRGITYGALDLADEGNGPAVGPRSSTRRNDCLTSGLKRWRVR